MFGKNLVKYVIRIESDGSAGGESKKKETPKTAKTAAGSSLDTGTVKKGITKVAAFHFASQAVGTVVSHYVNTVELRTGHAQLQRSISVAYNDIMTIRSIGMSVVAGAITGGPVGAAVAATATIVNKALEIGLEQERTRVNRAIESIGLEQAYIRSGSGRDRRGYNVI